MALLRYPLHDSASDVGLEQTVEPGMPPIAALPEQPQKLALGAAGEAHKSNVRHTGILRKRAVWGNFQLRQPLYVVIR